MADQNIVGNLFGVTPEMYQQQQADPENRDLRNIRTKDLGNGRTEVS